MSEPSNQVRNWTNKKRTWKNFLSGSNAPPPSKGLTYRNQKGRVIPKPSFVKKNKNAKPEYLLRAANMLSEQTNKARNATLKHVNTKNRNNLRKLLGNTRKTR